MRKLAFVVFSLVFMFVRLPSAYALDLSKFERLVVFGDSLSDNGNLFAITNGGNPPAPPIGAYGVTFDGTNRFFPGRFTDGQNWVDYFPSVAPSVAHFSPVTAYFNDGGTNFAVGGSTSKDLTAQIHAYLFSLNGHTPANDLCVIWIGANDFAAGSLDPNATVDNIRAGIALLSKAGAKAFIVISVPDLALTPLVMATPTNIQAAKQFVFTVNTLLEVEILPFAWLHRITVKIVDINAIFIPLVLNPGRFGFTNSSGEAYNPPPAPLSPSNPVSDPNDYVFWDGFHPTTNVHHIAAEFIYETVASRRAFPESVPLARRSIEEVSP